MATTATTKLAFALGGLGGLNAHGAGFLTAAREHGVEPDLVTATSGQIVVLAAYLRGEPDLAKGLIDPAARDDPFAQLRIMMFGYPGVFAPATAEAVRRLLMPPWLGTGPDMAQRFLPAQLYRPMRTARVIGEMAETFNRSAIGVVFNAYDPVRGEGMLFGNDVARDQLNSGSSLGYVAGQQGADSRAAKPADGEEAIGPITPEAIEAALWLTLYGFSGTPHGLIDGAYHRASIVSELHQFDRIVVCRPLACGWGKNALPQSYFDVQDWNTEMWFSVGYKAEVDAMKRINRLVHQKRLEGFNFVDILEVEPETPAGYFNYFIERQAVFDSARAKAGALFDWIAGGKVGPRPQ